MKHRVKNLLFILFGVNLYANAQCPTVNVAPLSRTLTCGGAPVSFTAITNSSPNVIGVWYGPGNIPVNPPAYSPVVASFQNPGTYTFVATDVVSTCSVAQTVVVVSNSIVPSMSVNAPTGLNITCTTPVLTLNITANVGPAPQTYTWTNLQTNVSTNPATGGYVISAPGTYSAAYMDGFGCKVGQQVTIMIDTLRPSPSAITDLPSSSFTLNCYNPVLTASAVTNPMLPVSSYSWIQPSPSLVVASHTMQVNTTSVTSNPTTFTVLAKGANGCVGRVKVLFWEDLFVPVYKVVSTPSVLTCSNPSVAISLQYVSGPLTAANFTISSPPPTTTTSTSGALFGIPGVYSATVMLLSNGCTVSAQPANVPQNTTPPPVGPPVNGTITCGSNTASIGSGTTGNPASYNYSWVGPSGSTISSPNANTTTVDMPGGYTVIVTDPANGCSTVNIASVVQTTALAIGITGGNSICLGQGITLTASGAASYTWDTGSNNSSIVVSPTVTTNYTVMGQGTGTCSGQSGQSVMTVSVSVCTGIQQIQDSHVVSVYPNPTTGVFTIKINEDKAGMSLELINTIGQKVLIRSVNEGENEIRTSGLAKGLYYYSVKEKNKIVSFGKIMIE